MIADFQDFLPSEAVRKAGACIIIVSCVLMIIATFEVFPLIEIPTREHITCNLTAENEPMFNGS